MYGKIEHLFAFQYQILLLISCKSQQEIGDPEDECCDKQQLSQSRGNLDQVSNWLPRKLI